MALKTLSLFDKYKGKMGPWLPRLKSAEDLAEADERDDALQIIPGLSFLAALAIFFCVVCFCCRSAKRLLKCNSINE